MSQIYLYVFSSTDQTDLTILQEPSRSSGIIISYPGSIGLLLLTYYHFILRFHGTFYLNINLTVTVIIIQHKLSQMYGDVFPSKYQIKLTILWKPSRSPGTIDSSLGFIGLLILSPIQLIEIVSNIRTPNGLPNYLVLF